MEDKTLDEIKRHRIIGLGVRRTEKQDINVTDVMRRETKLN